MLPDDILAAIRRGETGRLELFLRANPEAVNVRTDGQRTLLHIATDWPGHFPHVRETIQLLAAHGADLNAAFQGGHTETPLHWAASSNDLVALDTLLDLGADIEASGSVIGGGSPLSDAVAFAQWKAAHRLIARGARSTIWQSAALGLMDRLQEYFKGQLEAARYLLSKGAALDWVGHGGLKPIDAACKSENVELVQWLQAHSSAQS